MNSLTIDGTATDVTGQSFKVTNLQAGEARMDLAKQWASRPHDQRYLSLSAMYAKRKAAFDASFQGTFKPGDLKAIMPEITNSDSVNKLTFQAKSSSPMAASNWSFGQLAQRANAPASYLRKLPSPLVADCVNYGLRYNGNDEGVKIYVHELPEAQDGVKHELRAVTGPNYGRIPDHEVIRAVQNIAGDGTGSHRWKVPGVMDWSSMVYDPNVPVSLDTTTLYASDRDFFAFLVDDRNPIEVGTVNNRRTGLPEPDLMFRGFYITNSEVGSSTLKLASFYLRAVCCNRIMWGVEKFSEISIRHTKLAPSRFVHQAEPALLSFANGSVDRVVEGVRLAKEAVVARNDDELLDFLKKRSMTQATAKRIMDTALIEEGRPARTVWDVAQGITAVARDVAHMDVRVDLEHEAAKLLNSVA